VLPNRKMRLLAQLPPVSAGPERLAMPITKGLP